MFGSADFVQPDRVIFNIKRNQFRLITADEIENEADEFVRESLIPNQLWNSHPAGNTAKVKDILDLASKADIHKSIIAGRIRYERNNYRILWPHVGQGMVRKLFFN